MPIKRQLVIEAVALSAKAFLPYGELISAGSGASGVAANMGTARRFNRLVELRNLRPGRAKPNLCLYRCRPAKSFPFRVKLLERHEFSTQVFIPMGGARRYLVVVATGGNAPELKTLRAFVAGPAQGIGYRPGTWHHPLIALDAVTDFACLVYEDGGAGDCEIRKLAAPALIELP